MRQGSDADRYERKKSQYSRVEVESFMIINVLFFPPSLDSMKYDQHWLELRKENNLTNSNQFSQDVSIFCQGHRVSGSLFICIEQMAGNKPNSDIFKTFGGWTAW